MRVFIRMALGILLVGLGSAAGQSKYGVLDLGPNSYAYGINSAGQVVGAYYIVTPHAEYHAFLFSTDTGVVDIGTLGGSSSTAFAVNDAGQVVGRSFNASGNDHAFLYSRTTGILDLGTLGGTTSIAYGINIAGQVVGYSDTSSGMRSFLYTPGTGMKDLLGRISLASSINDAGQVTGYVDASGTFSATHPFLWTTTTGMRDLGTLGGSFAYGNAINRSGQVAGYSEVSGATHPFLWDGSRLIDLGTGGGVAAWALGVNTAGQVVGKFQETSTSSGYKGFLYSDSQMVDLITLVSDTRWVVRIEPTAINDSGQISATGYGIDGIPHALRLDPGGTSSVFAGPSANPGPKLFSIAPMRVVAGSADVTLTIAGIGFVPGSTVRWNGSARPTTVTSSTVLTTALAAADLATAGTANVSVVNPDGSTSQAFVVAIDSASTSISTSLSTVFLTAGQSIKVPVNVQGLRTPIVGSCYNAPAGVACTYDSATSTVTVQAGSATAPGTYTILIVVSGATTTGALPLSNTFYAILGFVAFGGVVRGRRELWVICAALLLLMIVLVACGGSSRAPTQTPSSQVSTSSQVSATVSLVVK